MRRIERAALAQETCNGLLMLQDAVDAQRGQAAFDPVDHWKMCIRDSLFADRGGAEEAQRRA